MESVKSTAMPMSRERKWIGRESEGRGRVGRGGWRGGGWEGDRDEAA